MQEARIVIFEDQENVRQLIKRNFEAENTGNGYDFSVVAEAATMESSRQLIETLDENEVDVAIVDGNLTLGETESDEGKEIINLLRSRLPTLAIIGYSGGAKEYGADFQLLKTDGYKPIVDCIKDL
jgi:DNA-binding NarL/FixJ family response regulator